MPGDFEDTLGKEGECDEHSDKGQLKLILGNHDKDGKICQHIDKCLKTDEISLEILSNFDDLSLQQTIDSWNIDESFHKKPFLIRGLLVNGIKNSSTLGKATKEKDLPSIMPTVISEREMSTMSQLNEYESLLRNQMSKIENESKTNEQLKYTKYLEYSNQITNVFDTMMEKMTQRKDFLLNEMETIFNSQGDEQEHFICNINKVLDQIRLAKLKYQENIAKYSKQSELLERSEINCAMMNKILGKQIITNKDNNEHLEKINYDCCQITFDQKRLKSVTKLMDSLGTVTIKENEKKPCQNKQQMANDYFDHGLTGLNLNNNNNNDDESNEFEEKKQELLLANEIINKNTTYDSDNIYQFDTLTIARDCVLTVNNWNEKTNKGGLLYIKCNSLILEYGAQINVNGKGYKGGISCHQGYSFSGNPNSPNNNGANFGGGGAGSTGGLWMGAGGGGGYGTNGLDGYGLGSGKGGCCYGDERMQKVHLGSGGGGTFNFNGTNGGGSIVIHCRNEIIISAKACITADGENIVDKNNKWSGCGSGGSIYLKAPKIVNNGTISAMGGINIHKKNSKSGHGGCGRIRIDCKRENKSLVFEGNPLLSVAVPQNRKTSVPRFSLWTNNLSDDSNKDVTPVIKPSVGYLHLI